MSHLLWKYYWENDVDRFCRLLAPAGHSHSPYPAKSPGQGVGSPGAFGHSPRVTVKPRKVSAHGASGLSKAEINGRDHAGLTILLRAASSTSPNAIAFVEALLAHPAIDLYAQDPESGWNALHRALYNGNISLARLLLEKERRDLTESLALNTTTKVGQLIKTKDHEGNSPFDVYNASIALRQLRMAEDDAGSEDDSSSEDAGGTDEFGMHTTKMHGLGEEVFTFGSNKNLSLGLGDEDDRQYPERVYLKRPDHLIQYFQDKFTEQRKKERSMEDSYSPDLVEIPALVQNRPLVVQDVLMGKLHTAILTTDPISNLYVCGVGRGGRLGLGDENTQFTFKPVQGGLLDKRVTHVALGLNHSMAITSNGELWTWGSNSVSQLGYALPPPMKPDEEPVSTTPRQVFGPLKKEVIVGIAASAIHSVAHTGSALYCWGKNAGQLALMDADSRSLEVQSAPRRVGASLLSTHSSIIMVSAIDRATTVLFEDRTVCVFTNYGYNMIKFPFYDGFTNSPLQRSGKFSMSARYDPGRREIHAITSGGETIAALTGSGDLFTMALNHKAEGGLQATSTTNPAKIKDAVTTPQLIWNSRKDGAKSVTIGENGTIMVSTQSGAVWRRVKRIKAKEAKFLESADKKRKDFKFQRVPYITGIVGVRSSMFGAYAAIRKDCDVTREQIEVDDQSLWHDLAPLCALRGFKAANPRLRENKDTWQFQNPEVLKGRVDSLGYEVLTCTDLEEDLAAHLRGWSFKHESTSLVVCTSSARELQIPVHSWVLAARSPILRAGLQRFRETGSYGIPDLLSVSESNGLTVIEFASIDIIALLNLVVFSYVDRVIPAWNFTRQSPPLAYRYRQVRTDLMNVAAKLGMIKLEHYVRIQSTPGRSMDQDFRKAIEDPAFFEDGDALLELDGDEIPVHSTLLCQRCPWFEGLFNGRSGGMWLASRRAGRDASEKTPIDLGHLDPEAFHYVLQHIYADVGEELFDEVVADSIDDFSELVMDVMSIANELMLDRLSQICQHVLGRFVTTRNISTLLNLMSPCSVTEFKDIGLEYICLQMETMLENHLLDNLDEDLMLELDQVVRDNQLARCPFAKSGRSDLLLHERYPALVEDIEEERQIRVKAMAYKFNPKDDEKKLSSSFKTKFGSLDDTSAVSPLLDKTRRKSKPGRNEPFSPNLRPKNSRADLIFDMDEEETSMGSPSPSPRPLDPSLKGELDQLPSLEETWNDSKGKQVATSYMSIASSSAGNIMPNGTTANGANELRRASQGTSPWAPAALSTTRLDLKDIMAESKPTQSALTAGIAAQKNQAAKLTPQKMSQKERKKFLQQQADEVAKQEALSTQKSQAAWIPVGDKKASPWQATPNIPKTSITNVLNPDAKSSLAPPGSKPLVVAEASSVPIPRRAASPDTRFSGQNRSGSATPRGIPSRADSGSNPAKSTPPQSSPAPPTRSDHKPLVPHSKSYIQKPQKQSESMTGLGLADIIGLQEREQQSVKEAVAKRNLEEIQQEQAFQEWWDAESRRIQDEESRRQNRDKSKDEKKHSGGRRGRGGKQRNGPSKDQGGSMAPTTEPTGAAGTSTRGRGRAYRGGKTATQQAS
ncbi:putative BTB/POZ domain-containing protein [Seiridium cardinale]|uniref:BTB/POZ domain-containing protein n=1 Tax=Seiridium cardinale TaxID=138064 RepID=A0ABR2XH68_9PEZI